MPKYENSVIYKLKHNEDYDDNNIYVGSTTNFKNRKNQHKLNCYNKKRTEYNFFVYNYIRDKGWDEWVMIPIEPYPCKSKKELEIRERHHIDLLRPTLNKKIPTRTKKEYKEDNKEYIAKHQKKYREKNKGKKREYYLENREKQINNMKNYYHNNKEIINQKVICDHCGCEIIKQYLKRHQKSKKCLKSQEDNVAR